MSNELQITVYTTEPPDFREERRIARNQTPQLARPVSSFLGAKIDPRGLAVGELRTFFKSLPRSKKIGDSDILTPFARAVRSARNARDQPEGSRRTKLFMFLSYVAVVATRVGHGPGLEALEDAMKMALGTQHANGEQRDIPLDYLKSLRTGVLHLHRVINCLVGKGWLPARATFTVISRAYLQPWEYKGLNKAHVADIVDGLLRNAPTDDGAGRNCATCVAAELAKVDSQLSRDTIHKYLKYKFECATCRSVDIMNINALLNSDQNSDYVTHASSSQTDQVNVVTEYKAKHCS